VPNPQRPGRRMQELRGYATTTAQLLAMAGWLRHCQVQRVVMESTSTYWKGVYYLLEAEGFDCWLVNAREVKNVPGRAKTDRADAAWLAKVAERGMCRPSLVQPPEIRRLRDLTRYRRALVQDRTREQQRVEKLLEDAQIKISAVLSNLHGVTGRAIMDALIAGERDPRTLARLAKASARKKTDRLEEALRGFFTEHHAAILQMMLDNSDRISAQIAVLDARIEQAIGPFSRPAARLADIPGVSTVAAAELIAEIGVDMTGSPRPRIWCRGPSSARRSISRPVSPRARAAARATRGWPALWAASRSSTPAPTPSWAPATGAWPDAAASRRRSSQPAIRC
jgi:transposase